jgi:hypothetical protein
MNDQITPPTGPEGFTKNYVAVFKGYFCKYVCEKEWDNFYEEDILMNEELRNNASTIQGRERRRKTFRLFEN